MYELTEADLLALADAIDLEEACASIESRYSGRGMYGDTCVGVVHMPTGAPAFAFELAVQILESAGVDVEVDGGEYLERLRIVMHWLAQRERHDSLGMQIVTYWPGLVLVS